MSSNDTERELTQELGKIERHLYQLKKRRETILDELDQGDRDV